jgi:type I restriction enzyme M protein
VQSKRSEVLFVDYMAEHLTPQGRAGIIVPEGIIFQSQAAYAQLRKMLVEDYLVAVISLPAGVFNPYSGVKTSILILDKSLAKKINTIAFFKIENDGFGLGAQRREIGKNDLPHANAEIGKYLHRLRAGKSVADFQPTLGLIMEKERIAANGEYNLSRERYRENGTRSSEYPHVGLGDVCDINPEASNPAELYPGSFFDYIDISCVENDSGKFLGANRVPTDEAPSRARRSVTKDDVLISTVRPNLKAFTILKEVPGRAIASTGFAVLRAKEERLLPGFLICMLRHEKAVDQMIGMMGKGTYPSINQSDVESVQIPVPPLEVQKEIVKEIEGYQKVINGARAVLDNYRPHIPIHPDWPMVELEEVSEVTSSKRILAEEYVPSGTPFYRTKEIVELNKRHEISLELFISRERYESIKARFGAPAKGDLLVSAVGTIGVSWVVSDDREFYFKDGNLLWIRNLSNLDPCFLKHCLDSTFAKGIDHIVFGAAYKALTIDKLKRFKIPLPALETQHAVVAEIEAEQMLVAANRELIERFERKIQAILARVWGENEPAPAEA